MVCCRFVVFIVGMSLMANMFVLLPILYNADSVIADVLIAHMLIAGALVADCIA